METRKLSDVITDDVADLLAIAARLRAAAANRRGAGWRAFNAAVSDIEVASCALFALGSNVETLDANVLRLD